MKTLSRPDGLTPVLSQYLAAIYTFTLEGKPAIAARLAERFGVAAPTVTETIKRLQRDGYLVAGSGRTLQLTPAGRYVAQQEVRRLTLVERWLTQGLGLDETVARREAERLVAVIGPELEARLMAQVGDPDLAPLEERPEVMPLDLLVGGEGQDVVVEWVGEADAATLRALERQGIVRGARLRLLEVAPWENRVVVECGGHQLTLERKLAERLRVRRAQPLELLASGPAAREREGPESYAITVESVAGRCPCGHSEGETFEFSGCTPGGLCADAFQSVYQRIQHLRRQREAPEDDIFVPCPEEGTVTFRVHRTAGK